VKTAVATIFFPYVPTYGAGFHYQRITEQMSSTSSKAERNKSTTGINPRLQIAAKKNYTRNSRRFSREYYSTNAKMQGAQNNSMVFRTAVQLSPSHDFPLGWISSFNSA
jgi:hypothetical protein